MLSIKRATIDDIPVIRELTFQIWPATYASILSTEQIAYMLDMMYSKESLTSQFAKGHTFILCYQDNEPVGFASWSAVNDGIYRLHKIYLLPQKQGSGIGKYMIRYIVKDVKKNGGNCLELNVNRYNPAKHFYEKLGFTIYREEDIDIGSGYFMNDYVLRYNITA